MSGISRLYPLLLGGNRTVDQAADEHKRLFGFYPRRDPNDRWTWENQRLTSSDYGHPDRQRQPSFDPARPFGLMNRIDEISINMQFEEDGLRSVVKWRLR